MDIQALKSRSKAAALVCCLCMGLSVASCTNDKGKEGQQAAQPDATAIQERLKATELAYEYEQFVNRIWQELSLLSDSLEDLRANGEVSRIQNRRDRMASIERRLKELGSRLKKAEGNSDLSEGDKQRISELQNAISRKNATIQKLKKEITALRDDNAKLEATAQQKSLEIDRKNLALSMKEAETQALRKSNSREIEALGDFLRRIVAGMEGIKGSGTYAPLKECQLKMVESSISLYRKANELNPSQTLSDKISRTARALQVYRNSKDLSGLDF